MNKKILSLSFLVMTFSAFGHAKTLSDMDHLTIEWAQGKHFTPENLKAYFYPSAAYTATCLESGNPQFSTLTKLYQIDQNNGDQIKFEGQMDFTWKDQGQWGFDIELAPKFTIQGQELKISNSKTPLDLDCDGFSNAGECNALSYKIEDKNALIATLLPDKFIQSFGLDRDGVQSLSIEMAMAPNGKMIAKVNSSVTGNHPTGEYITPIRQTMWAYTAYCELTPVRVPNKEQASGGRTQLTDNLARP